MIEKQSHHTAPATASESDIQHLFAQLPAQEIEQFYAAFQLYTQQQRLQAIEAKIAQTKQHITDNERHMQAIAPSPIALSELIQLQVCGVEDIDLLDRMLARGDEWLDHTMQLLQRCEQLNMIEEGYTHWCEHALDGAYEWIASMQDSPLPTAPSEITNQPENITEPTNTNYVETDNTEIATEDQLLRKLMSEDGDDVIGEDTIDNDAIGDNEISFTTQQPIQAKITRPLPETVQAEPVGAETSSAPTDSACTSTTFSPSSNNMPQPAHDETTQNDTTHEGTIHEDTSAIAEDLVTKHEDMSVIVEDVMTKPADTTSEDTPVIVEDVINEPANTTYVDILDMDEGVVKCHKDVTSEETLDVVANEITEPEVTDTDDELEDQWPYTYPDAITATKIKIIEPDQSKKEEQEEQDQGPKEEQEEQVREEEAATTAEEEESVAEASAQPRQQTTFKLRGRWRRSLAKIMRR